MPFLRAALLRKQREQEKISPPVEIIVEEPVIEEVEEEFTDFETLHRLIDTHAEEFEANNDEDISELETVSEIVPSVDAAESDFVGDVVEEIPPEEEIEITAEPEPEPEEPAIEPEPEPEEIIFEPEQELEAEPKISQEIEPTQEEIISEEPAQEPEAESEIISEEISQEVEPQEEIITEETQPEEISQEELPEIISEAIAEPEPEPEPDPEEFKLKYDFTSGERYVDSVSTKTEFDKMLDELSNISKELLSWQTEKFARDYTSKFQGDFDKAEADAKKYAAFLGGYITNAAMTLYDNGYKDAAIKQLEQAKSILETKMKLEAETEAIKNRVEENDDTVDLSDILGLFGDA